MKIVQNHYHAFQALAFSDRENWRWYVRPIWWYLNVFVWLHQGIFYKNWENLFVGIDVKIQNYRDRYRLHRNMKRILKNPEIAQLLKLAGIKK